ncbi:MAG: hypothetical protein JSW04_00570 [Desulfobacterales bacterium]|nr:MAG: hypothetical protein JSW04_00570 [Desulfobacterales bacterium]
MKSAIKILTVTAVIGCIGYFSYHQIMKWHQEKLDIAISQQRNESEKKTGELEDKINQLEDELTLYKITLAPQEKLTEIFGDEPALVTPEKEYIDCQDLERQVFSFFAYLDKQNYIILRQLGNGTTGLFNQMIQQLSEKLPIVVGENRDIISLTRNMAHFYRVLGKKRIELIKDILKNENDIFESMIAAFYSYYTSDTCCKDKRQGCPSLKLLYEYSGFFLSTIAGRSYLLRRDSKVRSLITYYCIRILDKANDAVLNDNGIDIRPHINLSLNDISNQKNLIYRKSYQKKLQHLKEKYHM